MAITVEQFRNQPPVDGYILIYHVDNEVLAINISSTACEGISVGDPLNALTGLILNIGGAEYNVTVLNTIPKGTYYTLNIVPFVVSSTDNIDQCTLTYLFPGVVEVGFNNSEYNALIGNATYTRRSQAQIFDVDRKSNLAFPGNLSAIISGSAVAAEVQDSFYSSTGITNGRYTGTKTSVLEYGVESSINLSLFDAASYPLNTSDNNICSQSLTERTIEVFGFDNSGNPKVSPDTLPTASYNDAAFDAQIIGDSGTPASLTSNQTTFIARVKKASAPYIKPGIFLQLTDTTNTIYVQVVSITFNSNYNFFNDVYEIVVKKHILTQSSDLLGNGSSDYDINIRVGFSDTVYFFEGNKIIPHSNKKLYLGLTGQIIRTGNSGRVIDISSTCPI